MKLKPHKAFVFLSLAVLSLFTLSLGMGLILTKTPESKALEYISLAQEYQEKQQNELLQETAGEYLAQQSYALANKALALQPYQGKLWKEYVLILAHLNKTDEAMKARDVAFDLGIKEALEIKTISTLLPERNLIVSTSSLQQTITR